MIKDRKILITGATGQVARPIAESLVKHNEVWCIARFTEPQLKAEIEALGIKTWAWTLGDQHFDGLPDDFDYVVHSACNIHEVAHDYDATIRVNAEGTGFLMHHVRKCRAFLYVSSLQVYADADDNAKLRLENEPLGCHPGYAPSYSISKATTEAVVRTLARLHNIPTIIGRLGMAYGTAGHGGVPTIVFRQMLAGTVIKVPPRGVSACSLFHEDDIVAQVEPLLNAASVPAQIVNWCGDDVIDEVDVIKYIVEISGLDPKIEEDAAAGWRGGVGDVTNRKRFTGPCRVDWKDGVKQSLKLRFPTHAFKA